MRKLARAIPALLLIALFSSALQAQTFNVEFDRATINLFHPVHVTGDFVFAGPGIQATGFLQNGDGNVNPTCTPCVAGETVSVYGNLQSVGYGDFSTINGASSTLWYSYGFQLNSSQLDLPYHRSPLLFSRTLPATLTGALRGYTRNPNGASNPDLHQVFETQLNFTGTVTLTFGLIGTPFSATAYSVNGRPFYYVQSIIYDFPPPGAAAK
jgi:hypothetical protein